MSSGGEQHGGRVHFLFAQGQRVRPHLHDALVERQRDIWVDWEDIPLTADWLKEIFAAIEAANTFVFVISPDSVASEVCGSELAHAVKHNKRLVPIVRRDVDAKTVPPALAALNWVFFRATDPFASALEALLKAIDTDLEWVRAHTRLLVRAIEWDAKRRNNSFLLRGSDLRTAEQWLAASGAKEPSPTQLQKDYIRASREDATRRQRLTIGIVAVGLLVACVLGLLAWNASRTVLAKVEK